MLNFGYTTKYTCLTCGDNNAMNRNQAREHILKHHAVSLKATKELVMHIAKEPRHITIYNVKFDNGIVLKETNF
jgi:hypothetical protein